MNYDDYNLETLLRTVFNMRMTCVRKKFATNNLSPSIHAPILFILRHETKNMVASQKEIAAKLGISAPTVAISIKRMEKAGLVEKIADETDLRRNLIMLTEKGKQLIDISQTVLDKIDEEMLNGFPQHEKEQLKLLFFRIIYNLEAMGAQPPEDLEKVLRQMDDENESSFPPDYK